jgi:hypothetical protein
MLSKTSFICFYASKDRNSGMAARVHLHGGALPVALCPQVTGACEMTEK